MEPYGDAGVPMRAGSDGACSGIACLRTWETSSIRMVGFGAAA